MSDIYYVDCGFDGFFMKVNLEQAGACIYMYCGPGKPDEDTCWQPTQYQTDDALHDADRAAVLCVQILGRGWYAPDEDEEDEDEDEEWVSAESVIVSVTEVSNGE